MADPWLLPWLTVITIAVILIALALLVGVCELHRTLRRVNRLLPDCQEAAREVCRTAGAARRILRSADRAAHELHVIIHQANQAVSSGLAGFSHVREQAKRLLAQRLGNGARVEPRRRYRGK